MKVLSPADVSAGLPAPSAAAALLGKGGAAALLVVLFLAVTSATSAELIAVSSILTFDVYKVTFLGIDLYSRHTKMLLCQYLEILQPKGYRAADPFGCHMHRYDVILCIQLCITSSSVKVAFFAVVMGFLGLIFFYIGISMGWLYVGTIHFAQFDSTTD